MLRVRGKLLVPMALAVLVAAPLPAPAQVVHDRVVSADPADHTPWVPGGRVNAIVELGDQIIAGGTFWSAQEPDGPLLYRSKLFAFDAATGAISPTFKPTFDARVNALASDGTSLFVGGWFTKVNGTTQRKVVKLDASGQVDPTFQGHVTSGDVVYDLVYANGTLYVAGAFTEVRGVPRAGLAALDPVTGEPLATFDVPFTGLHNGGVSHIEKIDITPDGTRLVAVGNFTSVAGQPRRQIAIVDLASGGGTLSSWSTERFVPQCQARADTYVRDVDISPDGSFFVVVTTGGFFGGAGQRVLCDTATRWQVGPVGAGQQPSWVAYTGGDTTHRVEVTGPAVYVGGHFRWWNNPFVGDKAGPGAVTRKGIAALDPLNGLPLSWNPGRKVGEGIFAFLATDEGLWAGSDTNQIGGEYHPRLAFFPLEGGRTVPAHVPSTLPTTLYSLPEPGAASPTTWLASRAFDGVSPGPRSQLTTSVDWSLGRGAFVTGRRIYAGWSTGRVYRWRFDGIKVRKRQTVPLRGLASSHFPAADLTGMFFDDGRLYYTVSGDGRLFMRFFTPESRVIGAETFVVTGPSDGFNWASVRGMTLASGTLYVARANGVLESIGWSGRAPVPGSRAVVNTASPQRWPSLGMFAWP